MPNNNEYPNQVPSAKEERLMPKFLRKRTDNGTPGEMHVPGAPQGLKVRATSSGAGCVYPDERGRWGRIGLPDRFKR